MDDDGGGQRRSWPARRGAGHGRRCGHHVFFEVVIGVGGHRSGASGRYVLAALLIAAGLILLGRRLLVARRP